MKAGKLFIIIIAGALMPALAGSSAYARMESGQSGAEESYGRERGNEGAAGTEMDEPGREERGLQPGRDESDRRELEMNRRGFQPGEETPGGIERTPGSEGTGEMDPGTGLEGMPER